MACSDPAAGSGDAPGRPGLPPRWTGGAKAGVGTAAGRSSPVWFTLRRGILTEVYYPRVDRAATRDLGLIVTDGHSFFSEEKRHIHQTVSRLAEGVPAYRLVNTCRQGRYRLEKEVLTDPARDVVLQGVRFEPLVGALADYRLFALLCPRLGNRGWGNTAWVDDYKGVPVLLAEGGGLALALACSVPWGTRSAGFVGVSDGWQDLVRNFRLTRAYRRAENGHVALCGEVDLAAGEGRFVLALGFGRGPAEAAQQAVSSLWEGFDRARAAYLDGWGAWQAGLEGGQAAAAGEPDLVRFSAAVIRTHEDKVLPGGLIAALAVPWGCDRGDDDLGGYHLVWPRDLVEAAGGLLVVGARAEARRILGYLAATQEADGHWPQNMWLDGTPYWSGVQLDETALPVLLVDQARREGALGPGELNALWPMVRRAAGFLVRAGPVTPQDRWEEDPGYSPFTLAVTVAALVVAADLARRRGEEEVGRYLDETAEFWNACVERWTYVTGTELARRLGVDGYYVRIAPPEVAAGASLTEGFVPIKNRPPGANRALAAQVVSPDALALVRFGLRAPDDPRIRNTVRVVDALLRVETPAGPAWRRYPGDGYGEHDDGSAFDGTGVGRAWPLLTGERAHYELAAGRRDEAERLRRTLEGFAGAAGLLPEQVWDGPDIPERGFFRGRPTGSAAPLVWAHAEYLKLWRSLRDGRVFDTPPLVARRFAGNGAVPTHVSWRFNGKLRTMPAGRSLRVEVLAPAVVHWSADDWQTVYDTPTRDTGLGVFVADLPAAQLKAGRTVRFTFYWPGAGRWEGTDFAVEVR
jgi:glucoamylase